MQVSLAVRALFGAVAFVAASGGVNADFPDEFRPYLPPIIPDAIDVTAPNAAGPRGFQPLLARCTGEDGAYTTIQSAIDAAVDGDVILVYPNDCAEDGRWHENIDFLGKAIVVQNANPNDPSYIDSTIIDGDAADSVVKFVNGEDYRSAIIGITITNGLPVADEYGGGVRCIDANPTIRRCVFRDNAAPRGSGIYVYSLGPILIDGCRFIHNTTSGEGNPGSAAYFRAGSSPVLFNCSFEQHTGYAISIINNVQAFFACSGLGACGLVQSCEFVDNVVPETSGSAISLVDGAGVTISDCLFLNNVGACASGYNINVLNSRFEGNHDASKLLLLNGVTSHRLEGVDFVDNYNVGTVVSRFLGVDVDFKMLGCNFVGNQASELLHADGPGVIRDCTFLDNTCSLGIVETRSPGPWEIEHCQFEGNECTQFGAVVENYAFSNGGTNVRHSTFIANRTRGSLNGCIRSAANVDNCLIAGNTAINGWPTVNCQALNGSTVVGNVVTGPISGVLTGQASNSIVQDNRTLPPFLNRPQIDSDTTRYSLVPEGVDGPGVVHVDPGFVDPGAWDDMGTPEDLTDDVFVVGYYHLRADSPCIDIGDPLFTPDADAMDLDGDDRVQGCRVDLGVDEYTQNGAPVLGDMNGDGAADLDDLPAFIAKTLDPYGLGVCAADVNQDGAVNGIDIAALISLILGN
ncbi:MAG TPA: right-handed parallel beta-helix repeat-containing protein [Phycisphaerae bacterium]|nr:right-handed parallel beta-helix repeat-containing protein [Phycisphaerae bacterium]HRW51710.1 right-handed parallel beta-helix repeat-containing protein [Phycisphaerae bacterium]